MSFEAESIDLRKLDRWLRTGDRVATLERIVDRYGSSGPTQGNNGRSIASAPGAVAIREMLGKIDHDPNLRSSREPICSEAAEIRLTDVASATNENPPEINMEPNRDTESGSPPSGTLISRGLMSDFRVGGGASESKHYRGPRQPGRGGDPGSCPRWVPRRGQFLPERFSPRFLGNAIGAPATFWGAASGRLSSRRPGPNRSDRSRRRPRNPPLILVKMSMSKSDVWTDVAASVHGCLCKICRAVSTTLQMGVCTGVRP